MPIVWGAANTTGVRTRLQHPASAGTSVWGRATTDPTRRTPRVPHRGGVRRPLEAWAVCRPGVSPAYLSWEQLRATQQRRLATQLHDQTACSGAPRGGAARRHGIARGGGGGARRWVRSRGARGQRPGDVCHTTASAVGEPRCHEVSAADVAPGGEQMMLPALEPDTVALAVAACAPRERDASGRERHWQ